MMDAHREAYLVEAADLLRELEGSLLELEQEPDNAELIGRVFRALHTIKGSGAMFGFDAIAAFAHQLESAFDTVREGRNRVTAELIGVTLDARDHIQDLLQAQPESGDLTSVAERILHRLREIVPSDDEKAPAKIAKEAPLQIHEESTASRTYRIRFEPHSDILLNGTNPILLFRELQQIGELSVAAHVDRIPRLADFNPDDCYTYWDAVLTTTASENDIRDVFIFVEDRARLEIECAYAGESEHRLLGEILIERGSVNAEETERCLAARPLTGEMLVEAGLTTQDCVEAAVLEQNHLDRIRESRRKAEAAATLRVPAAKLDALVNIVGELVTVQARLSGYALASGESEINFIAEEVERLTGLLRENTISVRMLPIGETFSRFKRLVRDLAGELGKKVELTTEGNETELDKTVIEQLNDPLVHLIRNAIDHGIELPEKRAANGKAQTGRIHLSAGHSGAFVLIRVSDDGAGLNRDAIRARAVERGMLSADADPCDQELYGLIMSPGFSTMDRVTAVSGRGVGMDVVQRSLNALRGTVSIASTPGGGTVVTLKIPLTLAIIDGLLVEVGGAFFVVPLANISECIELERRAETPSHKLINVRGELVPCITLRQRFGLAGEAPAIEQVIVAETRTGKYGFIVDRVIGDHNTVIKKLGDLYRNVEEVSGATILGDGRVALILDVDKIAAAALRENADSRQAVG